MQNNVKIGHYFIYLWHNLQELIAIGDRGSQGKVFYLRVEI